SPPSSSDLPGSTSPGRRTHRNPCEEVLATEDEVDLGAAAGPGAQPGVAVVLDRDLVHDGQPRARARDLAAHRAPEQLEHALGILTRNAGAAILDHQAHAFRAIVGLDVDLGRQALAGVLQGVVKE